MDGARPGIRIPKRPTATTVNFKVDIDLTGRPNAYAISIIEAMQEERPFVIYYNLQNFMLAIPTQKRVLCYSNGYLSTDERLKNEMMFVARLKIGMVVYDKFSDTKTWIARLQPHRLHDFLLPVQGTNLN
jgi:hypothetical protein